MDVFASLGTIYSYNVDNYRNCHVSRETTTGAELPCMRERNHLPISTVSSVECIYPCTHTLPAYHTSVVAVSATHWGPVTTVEGLETIPALGRVWKFVG